jgi:phenylacetate-CoA ligase
MNTKYPGTEAIRKVQEQKLQELLQYLGQNSPYYRQLFAGNNIDIHSIKSLGDLVKIPATTKEQMQERNMDFLCVDPKEIIEYTATSGTMGKPVTIALTQNDLDRLAYNEWLSFKSMGAKETDIIQLMLTLDRQFMAGIAYYSGIRKLGAGMVRVGPGAPAQQWEIIHRLKPTILVGVPSFILKLATYAREHHFNPNDSTVKKALCIGENIRLTGHELNALGKKIKADWDLELYGTYASTEMQTAFTECKAGNGGHLNHELLIVEILDEKDNPVPNGVEGEVTITTLDVEGMPLLRYKTGDICYADNAPCSCGRHTPRLSPVIGRKKQMIKLKGTTLYPPALFDILNELHDVQDYVVEVFRNDLGLDEVVLNLHPVRLTERTDRHIKSSLQGSLRVVPEIKYLPAEAIHRMQFPDGSRKAIKFIDRR